jgi:hypothetical protein
MPIMLVFWEVEIRRMVIQGQHRHNVEKNPIFKWRCSSSRSVPALQVWNLDFRPHPTKKERNPISTNKKVSVVVQTYHPSYVGSINGTIIVQTSQSINAKPYSNNKTRDTNMKDSWQTPKLWVLTTMRENFEFMGVRAEESGFSTT